jgi:hypothetical protein
MALLTAGSWYGEEDQARSKKHPAKRQEASGMDETTNPRTQGSLARQDTRRSNLEADQANARRVTPEGARTRIAARTSSIVFHLALLDPA